MLALLGQRCFALLWAAGITILFVLFWSLLPGAWEVQLQRGEPGNAYWRITLYEFTAISVYVVPVLVGLAIRESRWGSTPKWQNLWHWDHWTRIMPQVFAVLLLGTLAALLLLLANRTLFSGDIGLNRF